MLVYCGSLLSNYGNCFCSRLFLCVKFHLLLIHPINNSSCDWLVNLSHAVLSLSIIFSLIFYWLVKRAFIKNAHDVIGWLTFLCSIGGKMLLWVF